jgi:hypothetical protein
MERWDGGEDGNSILGGEEGGKGRGADATLIGCRKAGGKLAMQGLLETLSSSLPLQPCPKIANPSAKLTKSISSGSRAHGQLKGEGYAGQERVGRPQ